MCTISNQPVIKFVWAEGELWARSGKKMETALRSSEMHGEVEYVVLYWDMPNIIWDTEQILVKLISTAAVADWCLE